MITSFENRFSDPQRPLLIFDGYCCLCSRTVDFILRHDRHERFYFTTDTSVFTQLLKPDPAILQTVVLLLNGKAYTGSDAVIQILLLLGWPWKAASLIRIIPRFIREAGYRLIARNRYRWFGKRDSCRQPTPEEQIRFL